MKTGYDQYFKKARKAAGKKPVAQNTVPSSGMSIDDFEKQLRTKMKMEVSRPQQNKKSSIPWKLVGISFIGLILAFFGIQYHESIEKYVQKIEISLVGGAYAEEKAATSPKPASVEPAVPAAPAVSEGATSEDDLDHLKKLSARQKELDSREAELVKQEEELQKEKTDLERRLKELEEMRSKISTALEDKVKVDDQKVDTLVQVYSTMKPPQAAKIFESLDEDLAVEILGRMKKKNAAEIMNLLKAEKAQVFSERFAGYKRK